MDIPTAMTTYLKNARVAQSYNIFVLSRKIYPKKRLAKIDPFQSLPLTTEPTNNISQTYAATVDFFSAFRNITKFHPTGEPPTRYVS